MPLYLYLFLFGILFATITSNYFYIYTKRNEPNAIKKASLIPGIIYLLITILLFIAGIMMMTNKNVQRTLTINKFYRKI